MSAKTSVAQWMATLAVVMVAPSFANAEEISYSQLLDRIESLEAEIRNGGGAQKDADCGSCQKGWDSCDCSSRSVYAAYELTILRPYVSSNAANYLGSAGFSNDYGSGHRLIIGAEGDAGLGARVRYWFFNHGHALVPPGANTLNIDMDVFDLEATLHEQLYNWDFLVSGGVRYGRAAFSLGAPEFSFEGTGPTVSLEAKREVGFRGLYFLGNFRTSLLVGEIRDSGGIIAAPPVGDTVDDEIALVLESQLGIGWSRELRRTELHLRALWETQFWLNDTIANDVVTPAGGLASNLGLSGVTLAAELRY